MERLLPVLMGGFLPFVDGGLGGVHGTFWHLGGMWRGDGGSWCKEEKEGPGSIMLDCGRLELNGILGLTWVGGLGLGYFRM